MSHEYADMGQVRDGELVARTRTGDQRAYAELWHRYAQMAGAVARTYWWSADSDDLVAESFTRIYQAIRAGKGPTSAFKPYLFATMRNLAVSWGRARREIPIEHMEAVEDPASTDAAADADFDASLVSEAILALPERWQEVLWFGEVENLSMHEIGKRLDITERAAAVLAFRAREGLRQAWISAHLAVRPPGSKECRWTLGKLGAHARSRLTARDTRRVEAHIDQCADCRAKAGEARRASSRMLLVLFPGGVVLGAGSSAWESLTSAGMSANAAPMPASVTAPVAGIAAAHAGMTMLAAVSVVTLAVGVAVTVVSNTAVTASSPISQGESLGVASGPHPSVAATPSLSQSPAPVVTSSDPLPEVSTAPEAIPSPRPAPPAPPLTVTVPLPPVIIDIPTQVSRTQWISASVRCEIGADLSVTAYGVTLAAGVCAGNEQWQISLDVSSYPVASGTAIDLRFAQSNIAGISGTTSAEVVIVD